MQKINLIKRNCDYNKLWKDINHSIIDSDAKKEKIFAVANISRQTYDRRKKYPQEFRLSELEGMAKLFGKELKITFE